MKLFNQDLLNKADQSLMLINQELDANMEIPQDVPEQDGGLEEIQEMLDEAIQEEEQEGGKGVQKPKRGKAKEQAKNLILKKLMRHDKKTQLPSQKEPSSSGRRANQPE